MFGSFIVEGWKLRPLFVGYTKETLTPETPWCGKVLEVRLPAK